MTETHVYMQCHQGVKVEHFDVSNVIYHKFSHGAVSCKFNVENVNVMLKWKFKLVQLSTLHPYCMQNENWNKLWN